MRTLFVFIFTMAFTATLDAQEIDTLVLKNEVVNLKTFASKFAYLKKIYEEDQKYRGSQTNDSLDYQHIISIAYFINEFEYPREKDFGRYASALWLIWIHNKYREIDKVTFPVILKGFLCGEIKEKDLRTYYLRELYISRYDDEKYKTIPLKELFKVCEVNLDETISIKNILNAKTAIDNFDKQEALQTSCWKSEGTFKTFSLNSKNITTRFEGQLISIIKKSDGKLYLLMMHNDHSAEPRPLENIAPNKYKFEGQETDKYFEFSADRILYKDKSTVLEEYKNVDGIQQSRITN